MKTAITAALVALGLSAAPAVHADPLVLTTGLGGADVETITGLTLGNSITFEYSYDQVTWTGGNFVGFNASVVNPPFTFPAGQFNDNRNATTGWLSASIATGFATGAVRDLAFTANTFGSSRNQATILVRNVAIDGRVVAGAVPAPGAMALLGIGMLAMGALAIRRVR
jgi:hypothetical protein